MKKNNKQQELNNLLKLASKSLFECTDMVIRLDNPDFPEMFVPINFSYFNTNWVLIKDIFFPKVIKWRWEVRSVLILKWWEIIMEWKLDRVLILSKSMQPVFRAWDFIINDF